MKILFYAEINQLTRIEHLEHFITAQNFNISGGRVD
jgi:hypothetical protein